MNRAEFAATAQTSWIPNATQLSAGGVAVEWVTQMLPQGDAQVFKKYSQMKLQMKREALPKLPPLGNRDYALGISLSFSCPAPAKDSL
jgi:hypothetical protein